MKKITLILVCFLIVLSGIGIVNAETVSGSLGESGYNSTLYTLTQTGAIGTFPQKLFAGALQQTEGTSTLVLWTSGTATYDAGAPAGATTPFQMKLTDNSGVVLGTGTMGYQRLFTTGGVEQSGYIWLQFTNYTTGGYTGNQKLWINYSRSDLYNLSYSKTGASYAPNPNLCWCSESGAATPIIGDYNHVKDISTTADYTATKPSGIGISGTVTKTLGLSQAFIFNSSGSSVSSEYAASSSPFNFTVSNEQIKIGIYTSAGIWYNSSLLFSPGITPTPTVTMTPVPTIVPGYVRSTLHVWDRAGNHVNGANIAIKDNEAGAWSNSTSDADGIHYIDTLPYHTLDAYAEFTIFANELLPGEIIGHDVGYYGGSFFITLFPYESGATPGNVSFYVEVKDAQTKNYLTNVIVDLTVSSTGRSYTQNTANAGSAIFLVPNNTVVYATARKDGYVPQTQFANSGVDTTEVITIELSRAVVTPTPTGVIPTGGVTPAITVDPVGTPDDKGNYPSGYSNVKGQQMLDYLAANGMQLVQLCFLVTILALLGVKLGK